MARVGRSSSSSSTVLKDAAGNPYSPTNPLPVSSTAGTVVSQFQSIPGVAMGSTSTAFTFTATSTLAVQKIMVSSDSISSFDILINNVLNCRKRITYTQFNIEFDYQGYILNTGDTISVVGTNNSQQSVAEFDVTLIGVS